MSKSSGEQRHADVVFVGAGPVGLWTAIQAKLRNPDLEIVMHEKYEEYKRSHVLRLDKKSFHGIPDSQKGKELQQLIAEFPKFVKTNVIEDTFKQFAQDLGIKIVYEEVKSCEALAERYPETTVFVGSDGSHSFVRREVFNDEKQVEKDLQYIAELKYFVEGKTTKLNLITEAIPVMSYSKFTVSEHVGKERDGKTPVTVRFFIDKETFNQLRGEDGKGNGAKFNNPYTISDLYGGSMPTKLATSMKAWMKWRKKLRSEVVVENEKITAINLAVYASQYFVKEANGRHWALVGDAALGVPYFRALNAGLLCGTQLAIALKDHFSPQESTGKVKFASGTKSETSPLQQYARAVQRRVNAEFSKAKAKDKAVNTGRFLVGASVADVHVSRPKLMAQTSGPTEVEVQNIHDTMLLYIMENYSGLDDDIRKYREILEYFTDGDSLLRMRDFPAALSQAYKTAELNIPNEEGKAEKLNEVVNSLKASIYKDALEKQKDLHNGRKKTAKLMSLWGLFLPIISHVIILIWYLVRLWQEPLKSELVSAEEFQKIYGKKKGREGLSQTDLLSHLSHEKEPVRNKNGELKARRAFIPILEDEQSEEASSRSEEDAPLLAEGFERKLSMVEVISTRWNRQHKAFEEKIANAQAVLAR